MRNKKIPKKVEKVILEIDARAICKTYKGTLKDVPEEFWLWISGLCDIVWIKAPWERSPMSELMMGYWSRMHKEKKIKRIASGYDVFRYSLDPEVAEKDSEFTKVVALLKNQGVRVITDFVTNHIALDSPEIVEVPGLVRTYSDEFFSSVIKKLFSEKPKSENSGQGVEMSDGLKRESRHDFIERNLKDPFTRFGYRLSSVFHFLPPDSYDPIVQHARNGPFGPPMPNLAQLDIIDKRARKHMIGVWLSNIARLTCSGGVRADLAFLGLKEYLWQNWAQPFDMSRDEFDKKMPKEFWQEFMEEIAKKYPQMMVFAETYEYGETVDCPWKYEKDIKARAASFVRMGIFPYHKRLYDLLLGVFDPFEKTQENINLMRDYLRIHAPKEFLQRSVHFTENHDEPAVVEAFGRIDRALAATVISGACPGYFLVTLRQVFNMIPPEDVEMEIDSADGGIYEFEYPDFKEKGQVNKSLIRFLKFLDDPVFSAGDFFSAYEQKIEALSLKGRFKKTTLTSSGVISFIRYYRGKHMLVVVNFSHLVQRVTFEMGKIYKYYPKNKTTTNIPGKLLKKDSIFCSKEYSGETKFSYSDDKLIVTLAPYGYGFFGFKK